MDVAYFEKHNYDGLHKLQVGRFGEYWVKIFLTLQGLEVYSNEVDKMGIDLIVRLTNSTHIDIQVKTIRWQKTSNYVFITKTLTTWSNEDINRENLYVALVLLKNYSAPVVYLIPSKTWLTNIKIFSNKEYKKRGLNSNDEWGLNLSKKNLHLLEPYKFDAQIETMTNIGKTQSNLNVL